MNYIINPFTNRSIRVGGSNRKSEEESDIEDEKSEESDIEEEKGESVDEDNE
nr:11353_t:CDS:2 [Entrophospora candida]